MTMPFGYASPEQQVRDKSEYARKGIARGRSVVVITYADGILFVAENPSATLHKISEIYDRIAFAAVGKYNEFENLRTAGIRLMDSRGYMYDRRDVTSRALANAQTLGAIFTESVKPYEVEIVVAEVGRSSDDDQIYRLTFDGSIADERGFVAIGGASDQVTTSLKEHHRDGQPLADALRVAVQALTVSVPPGLPQNGERVLTEANLEVGMLDRSRARRQFKRITGNALAELLAQTATSS
ncbi:proteasome subunit alpha [Frankia gtarii]|uniref:proteasome subunit alpha n=1 Tax=Frankia gtarii TaxID=2950102 RepID=UPI0021C0EE30|nr:proteasome subunit alpha [Frankia gtarii]